MQDGLYREQRFEKAVRAIFCFAKANKRSLGSACCQILMALNPPAGRDAPQPAQRCPGRERPRAQRERNGAGATAV